MNDVKRSQGVAVEVRPLCISEWVGPILASSGRELGMQTLALMQVGTTPDWVGPTMAISLAILALSFLGMAIAVAVDWFA